MQGQSLKGHLDALLLAVIGGQRLHGYAIVRALKERSEGVFDLPESTIYPALYRLEGAGLLASAWTDDAPRRRRIYWLTERGHTALAKGAADWRTFVTGANAIFGEPPWPNEA